MQTQIDLQQNARDNENQKRNDSNPDSNSPTRFFTSARKKSSKTKPLQNRAQVTLPRSETRLAANRENAKKCTGPRTKRGKARSSQNARKYTPFAKLLLIRRKDSTEDAADFGRLLADLIATYSPTNPVERFLVESLAACLWRRQRAYRFESAALERQIDKARIEYEDTARRAKEVMEQFEEVNALVKTTQADVDLLRKQPAADDTAGQAELAATVARLAEKFGERVGTKGLVARLLERLEMQQIGHAGRMIVIRDEMGKVAERQGALRMGEADLCLPPPQELGQLVRYENMLNRQLHRALTELRRLRETAASRPDSHKKDT